MKLPQTLSYKAPPCSLTVAQGLHSLPEEPGLPNSVATMLCATLTFRYCLPAANNPPTHIHTHTHTHSGPTVSCHSPLMQQPNEYATAPGDIYIFLPFPSVAST